MSNEPYTRECRDCKEQIKMQQTNGKWAAYNLTGTEFHKCNNRATSSSTEKPEITLSLQSLNSRVIRLEKVMDAFLNDSKGEIGRF